MKTPALSAALGLAMLLAATPARAQSDADASVPVGPSQGSPADTIRLTPPTPDGGIYGVPDPGAPVATPPATSPTPDAPPVTVIPPPPPPPTALVLPDPFAPPVRPHHLSLVHQRLRLLDSMLPPLAARSRSQRVLDGVISLVVGTAVGTIGFFMPPTPEYLRPIFWVGGGLEIVSGVVTLAWAPARETLTARFVAMPMATAADRRNRLRFGEHALNEMAADGARRRVIGAIGSAVLPVGLLAAFYAPELASGTFTPQWPDYLIVGLTAAQVVIGLIPLFGQSEEERLRNGYYQQLRMMQAEQLGAYGP